MFFRSLLAACIAIFLVSITARADLLGSATLGTSDTYSGSGPAIQLGIAVGPDTLTGPYLLTDVLDTNSDGAVFTFDSSSPNFAAVVAGLTNGQDDLVELAALYNGTPQSSANEQESIAFLPYLPLGAVDFAGATIDQIVLTVDNISINDVDIFTFVSYDGTIDLYGSIPEPAALSMLALGTLALRRRRSHA